jgi:alkylation response protein AidB-like acyl-CoA dehydrogenase
MSDTSSLAGVPQQTTVLDRVRALLPEISSRAEEIEQARAVPRDLVEKLRSAGVFRRYVPRSHGGDEMWPDEGLTVIEELASADASVAWIAAIGSEGPSFYAYLPSDTYDKIYSAGADVIHSGVINATGRAVRDKGGYRFSGRWSFASALSGTTGMLESFAMQRRLRDASAVTQHYMLSVRSAFGPVGAAILGEDSPR